MKYPSRPSGSPLSVPPARSRAALSDALFAQYRQLIYDRTGIYFKDNKKYLLESRVGRRMATQGISTYEAYLQALHGRDRAELNALINAITINETSFFRSPTQFEVIVNTLVPEILDRNGGRGRVRLWSAACSTGDEPYTLAMMLKSAVQPRYPNAQFDIIGTDINTEVLEAARHASYSARAVRSVPDAYRRHFREVEGRYVLSPEIRKLVTFKQLNLMDTRGMQSLRGCDVIVCANVLIYFDTDSKVTVIDAMRQVLNPGGYLLVGFSETLYGLTDTLKAVRHDKVIAYQK